LDTEMPSVLRALGQSVPNWALVTPPTSPLAAPSGARGAERAQKPDIALNYSDTRLRAMQRIVELGKLPEEIADRFDHMLQTAVEQFNQGALGRAVSILESANQLVVQERIPTSRVKPLWDKAADKIQWHRFEATILDPVQHQLLGQFLSFFPAFSPVKLLAELKQGSERTGRRLLISLLAVRGDEVRSEAWKHFEPLLDSEEPDWEHLRNLAILFASLPLKDGRAPEEEVKLMTRLAGLPLPLPIFREAARFATRIDVELGTGMLATLLAQESTGDADEIAFKTTPGSQWTLLFEQILTKLAGSRDIRMRRLVLDHCLDNAESTGISTGPLAALRNVDLASEPDIVERLLTALSRNLPWRWLSWISRPNDAFLLDLVRSLSGTPSPRIQSALIDVARRFPQRPFGVAAARATGTFVEPEIAVTEEASDTEAQAATAEPVTADLGPDILLLEGELHSFKLPTLIQHLESTAATGILELLNSAEVIEGTATFVRGQLFHCHAGHLRGKEALFALLEKPVFGRFRVVNPQSQESTADTVEGQPALPVVPTLLEGMRRYDEYQQFRLLVPDHITLMPAGVRPGRPEGENDPEFVRQVWAEAVSGKTAADCEAVIRVDPYRVRRLLAYWAAEGSLSEVQAARVKTRQEEKQATE
ncbi:MAG: DUF4388 domain-containing protein, partial [Acidobacteria bacterium]